MGKTQWRAIDGVVLLNKPLGLSSNQALQKVRRVFRAAKAGHTGALDPLAAGMLPLCLGEATKFSQFLLDAENEGSDDAAWFEGFCLRCGLEGQRKPKQEEGDSGCHDLR